MSKPMIKNGGSLDVDVEGDYEMTIHWNGDAGGFYVDVVDKKNNRYITTPVIQVDDGSWIYE